MEKRHHHALNAAHIERRRVIPSLQDSLHVRIEHVWLSDARLSNVLSCSGPCCLCPLAASNRVRVVCGGGCHVLCEMLGVHLLLQGGTIQSRHTDRGAHFARAFHEEVNEKWIFALLTDGYTSKKRKSGKAINTVFSLSFKQRCQLPPLH